MPRPSIIQVTVDGKPFAPGNDLVKFSLTQLLAGHHNFELTVPFDRAESSEDWFFNPTIEALLGKPVTIEIKQNLAIKKADTSNQLLKFKGIITELGTNQDSDAAASVTVIGSSFCIQLADGVQKRTFVDKTLADIFTHVLNEYHSDLARKIKPVYTTRLPYVVQYQESNYDFLARLAAEYGEWFYYDGLVLCLGLPVSKKSTFQVDGEYSKFSFAMNVQPVKSRRLYYNHETHKQAVGASETRLMPSLDKDTHSKLAFTRSKELFAHSSRGGSKKYVTDNDRLKEELTLLKASSVANLVVLKGESDNMSFQLGEEINVTGKGLGSEQSKIESFGQYRIIELTHQIDEAGRYSNTFKAASNHDVPPSLSTRTPPSGTTELATVIDTQDLEKLGRVRVRFKWDVDAKRPQDAETDWLRVLTPYSGDGKGHLFTPEKDSQVLIGYTNGLADQPYVQGNLFHATENKQEYTYEKNKIKSIQTAGGNKITFDDTKGQERILITNGNKDQANAKLEISFAKSGAILLYTKGEMTLRAEEKITILSKVINLGAKAISLITDNAIAIHSKGKTDIAAGSMTIRSNETTMLSKENTNITGKQIRLN